VLATATCLLLRDGYAGTSMEAVAEAAAVSKRTLYRYHPDKRALFRAVVGGLIEAWRPPFEAEAAAPGDLAATLLVLARRMLRVALTPEALALHRLAVAEAGRFPEIVQALHEAGVATGIDRIAALLAPALPAGSDTAWLAEQFQRLVLDGPQSRALGFGAALDEALLADWAERAVLLFLRGSFVDAPVTRG
jgi:AcrR family transcriptional regulator